MAAQPEETEKTEFGDLCDQLVEHVFSFVPLKSLAMCKAVSKSWRQLIDGVRRHYPPTTDSGIVLHLRTLRNFSGGSSQESIFLTLHDLQAPERCTVHSTAPNKFPFLIDSCNGMLLYGSVDGAGFWSYHVSSPILGQLISLPPAHSVYRAAFACLAFDPRKKNPEFKIDCFFWEEVNPHSQCVKSLVFSSESWEWKEKQGRILNSELILENGFIGGHCFGPAVYSNSRFHLIWGFCFLIFDEDGDLFTLFPLPRNHFRKTSYNQQLWVSEGKLHLCDPCENGFQIWQFEWDGECMDRRSNSLWRSHQFVPVYNLISEIRAEKKVRLTVRKSIKSCAFNEDLQVLYILVHKRIVAYSLETKSSVQVWAYEDLKGDFQISYVRTFLFKHVNLLDFKKSINQSF